MSDTKTDDTQRDALDADTFDLRGWLDDTKVAPATPTRSVKVYMRPDLQGIIEADDIELHRVQGSDSDESDNLLVSKGRERELAERIEANRREMERTAVVFRFRGPVNQAEIEGVKDGVPKGSPSDEATMRIVAALCVQPADLSADDMRRIRDRIGEPYFVETLLRTANKAVEGNDVDVPFSLAASALMARSSDG